MSGLSTNVPVKTNWLPLQMGTPYNCKDCGATGRMISTRNRPICPQCGRRMRYKDKDAEKPGDSE